MQFAVITRALDRSSIPIPAQLMMVEKTFELLKSKADPRIKETYGFAGERAGILIIEANSGDEITEIVGSLPFFNLVQTEVHPLASIDSALTNIRQAQERFTQMTPAGVG
jgi:muconolactone delta-isomerase